MIDGIVHGIVDGVVGVVKRHIGKRTNDHCNEKEDIDGFEPARLNGSGWQIVDAWQRSTVNEFNEFIFVVCACHLLRSGVSFEKVFLCCQVGFAPLQGAAGKTPFLATPCGHQRGLVWCGVVWCGWAVGTIIAPHPCHPPSHSVYSYDIKCFCL